MTTPQEYRQYAEECLRWAREAKTEIERQQLLELANAWVQAAALQDGALPTYSPPPASAAPAKTAERS
jgi:hypothetical protein